MKQYANFFITKSRESGEAVFIVLRKKWIIAGAILIGLVVCSYLLLFQTRVGINARISLKNSISQRFPGMVQYDTFYENNKILMPNEKINYNKDIKEIALKDGKKMLAVYSAGYSITLPQNTEFDFSLSPLFVKANYDGVKVVLSREYNPYPKEGHEKYIMEYPDRFIEHPRYIKENKLNVHINGTEQIGSNTVKLFAFTRTPFEGSAIKNNTYVFAYIYGNEKTFFRVMFNADSYSEELISGIRQVLATFEGSLQPIGQGMYDVDYKPVMPTNWSKETKAVYEKILKLKKPIMGAYRPRTIKSNHFGDMETLETNLDYEFGVAMDYISIKDPFPVAGMNTAYEKGKIVELTIHTGANDDGTNALNGYNPNFEIYDGLMDEQIKKLAIGAKEFGKPFLLRLNNEMNSDWTCYGGPATLNDPEIYQAIWRRIYDIFTQEGVNNAIWIFNPNDNNYPPCNYNNFLAYYPGNEYVQMLGITGYNTGDYYKDVFGEKWHGFLEIYDKINEHYYPFFGRFPWIITEFSTSSYGGDKPAWIRTAVEHFTDYKNLKIAVWFSNGDMDFREGRRHMVARPYNLDENQDCIKAFRDAVKDFGYDQGNWSLLR